MKEDKLEKWLSNRRELIVPKETLNKIIPFISPKGIDPQTSSDLLLGDYFDSIDLAITGPGRYMLYSLLHAPLPSKKDISGRRNFMDTLAANQQIRIAIKKLLWKVRYSPNHSENTVIFESNRSLFTKEKLAFMLIIFVVLVIAIPLLINSLALYSVLLFIILSFLIFARNLSIYNEHIPGLISLGAHYKTAKKLIRLFKTNNIDSPEIRKLNDLIPEISSIMPFIRILCTGTMASNDPLQLPLFLLKNIFCIDLLAYNKAIDIINSKHDVFKDFYCCYGIIDAIQVLSEKYALEPDQYCKAEFYSERSLSATNAYHPLLTSAVSNSVSVERGIILTGSNMSGKSTFLRTIGLNAILAQTIGYCHANQFCLPIMNIVTVINKQDNLQSGESFYFFEAKRIAKMINMDNSEKYLFLIDELLSGTNSLERVSASISILRYLLEMKHIIFIAATHDVSIASHLVKNCGCYYFSDLIEKDNMKFDYKLREGIIKTTNAIKMLEIIGLPESIIKESETLLEQTSG